MEINCLFVLLFVLMIIGVKCNHPRCPRYATEENGSCYWVIPFKYTVSSYRGMIDGLQVAAHAECGTEQPGAGLVTINSFAENNFIYDWIRRFSAEPRPLWTGLYQPRVAGQGPVWLSGERGNLDLVEPLDWGEGAVLFLNDYRRAGPRWEGEDPFEWGSRPSALCEYKLSRPSPSAPTIAPTANLPTPGGSQSSPIGPRMNLPRRRFFPSYNPFSPGPLSIHRPLSKDGYLQEVIRYNPSARVNRRFENMGQYGSGTAILAIP